MEFIIIIISFVVLLFVDLLTEEEFTVLAVQK